MDEFHFLGEEGLTDDEISLHIVRTLPGDSEKIWLPAYFFAIQNREGKIVGNCELRIGYNENIRYIGNIGYRIATEFRGHQYAEKASRILLRFAARHGMPSVWITCDPNNTASRKTCERLGAILLEITELPTDSPLRMDGKDRICIYRYEL